MADDTPNESNPHVDGVLAHFVRMANQSQFEASVTLLVHGIVITGTLTSAQNYMAAMGDTFATGVADPALAAMYQKSFQEAAVSMSIDDMDFEPDFIHLKRARFVQGGTFHPRNTGVWWRGRLESVDGWFFGVLSQS